MSDQNSHPYPTCRTGAGLQCLNCGRGVYKWLAPDESPCACPEPKDRAADEIPVVGILPSVFIIENVKDYEAMLDEYGLASVLSHLSECATVFAREHKQQATQEVLAAVVEVVQDYKEANGHFDYSNNTNVTCTDIKCAVQSLTINSTSLEKFAERVKQDEKELLNDITGCGHPRACWIETTDESTRSHYSDTAHEFVYTCIVCDKEAELRQPIDDAWFLQVEDKSVCPVGHMKVNLRECESCIGGVPRTFQERTGNYIHSDGRGYTVCWQKCLACQDLAPLREVLETIAEHSDDEAMKILARQALERKS